MADRRKPQKSPYTVDRDLPGAFEGETMTRRRMMTGTAHLMGGLSVAAFTLPALGFALGPIFERDKIRWEDVGAPDDFPDDTYVPKVITLVGGIGETGKTTVYMRKRNPAPNIDGPPLDEFDNYVAISTRCMHLGCPVRYVEASERFICPCHGGVYEFDGGVGGGPPVRPLDRFETKVVRGRVLVGDRFSLNTKLERKKVRDPSNHLDGLWQYIYPSRPTV